jgi:hypothetical protein
MDRLPEALEPATSEPGTFQLRSSGAQMRDDRRPRVCLFVGPSLAAAEIETAFRSIDAEVTVLPPVQQGDILRLAEPLPDVIGIIDGLFFHVPSVLHREILFALERGARVLGAASTGALRAAELDAFGMEGVGEIYRLYRDGAIDADDEVAVLHAGQPEGYRPLTEALISVRHNLRRARAHQVISSRSAAAVLVAMKRLHFSQRTWAAALAATPQDERAALAGFLERDAVDPKQQDALLLVRTIVDRLRGAAPWPARALVRVNQTSLFHYYRREYEGREVAGSHLPDALVLAFERLLAPSFLALYRQASRRCLAIDEARHRGLVADDSAALVARFRRARGLGSDTALRAWLAARCMSQSELIDLLRERDLEAQVLATYRDRTPGRCRPDVLRRWIAHDVSARSGVPRRLLCRPLLLYPGVPASFQLVRELKLSGRFASAAAEVRRIMQHNAGVFQRCPWLVDADVRPGLLIAFFARRWGVDRAHFDAAIAARGFTDYGDFVRAARHVFVYARTSEGVFCPERLTDCFLVE